MEIPRAQDRGSPHKSSHDENYRYEKYGRFWAVYDGTGQMVCVAVYRKGAQEVVRRLRPQATVDAACSDCQVAEADRRPIYSLTPDEIG